MRKPKQNAVTAAFLDRTRNKRKRHVDGVKYKYNNIVIVWKMKTKNGLHK